MGGSRRDATTPILVHTGSRVDAHIGRRSVAIDGSAGSGRRRSPSSARVEAFSDAVFAIIITLLVLEIGRPEVGHGNLGSELPHQWPEYLAFAASFLYVGVIWLNHHALFSAIRGVDSGLNWINLGILGTSSLVPFPTGVLASALSEGTRADQQAAVALYAIVAALMSAAWLPLFPYLHRHPELLVDPTEARALRAQRSRPWVGVLSFAAAAILGYLFGPVFALPLFVWMIAYHAATSEGLDANRIARLFSPRHRSHAAEDRRLDLRSESLASDEAPTEEPTHDPENRGA
jgi:TMEM175 potassium channel family protein